MLGKLLQTTVTASVFWAVALCGKRLIFQRCGVRFWCRLVGIAAFLFVFPLPFHLLPAPKGLTSPLSLVPLGAASRPLASAGGAPAAKLLAAVYLLGAALSLLTACVSYRRYRKKMTQTSRRLTAPQGQDCLRALSCPYPVLCSPHITSPVSIGFFRPAIVLPDMEFSQEEYAMILHHEMAHIKRRDQWKKLALVVIRAMHWFSPLAYLFLTHAEEAIELSCDLAVTKTASLQERGAYCDLLVTLLWRGRSTITLNHLSKKSLKHRMYRRFSVIMDSQTPKPSAKPAMLAAAAVFAAALLGLGLVFSPKATPGAQAGGDTDYADNTAAEAGVPFHDLSADGAVQVSASINAGEIYAIPAAMRTNSHAISIQNNGGDDITVSVYSDASLTEPIRQLTVRAHQTTSLTGLTSRFLYSLTLTAAATAQANVTISD